MSEGTVWEGPRLVHRKVVKLEWYAKHRASVSQDARGLHLGPPGSRSSTAVFAAVFIETYIERT